MASGKFQSSKVESLDAVPLGYWKLQDVLHAEHQTHNALSISVCSSWPSYQTFNKVRNGYNIKQYLGV